MLHTQCFAIPAACFAIPASPPQVVQKSSKHFSNHHQHNRTRLPNTRANIFPQFKFRNCICDSEVVQQLSKSRKRVLQQCRKSRLNVVRRVVHKVFKSRPNTFQNIARPKHLPTLVQQSPNSLQTNHQAS